MIDPVAWFAQLWPRRYRAVLSDYAALKQHRHLLADVALRGKVFGVHPPTDSLYEAGRREGRRELALEIIRLAGEDTAKLFELIEKAGQK